MSVGMVKQQLKKFGRAKLPMILFSICFLVALPACDLASGGAPGVVTESQYNADLEAVYAAEQALEDVGLVFQLDFSTGDYVMVWEASAEDEQLLKSVVSENPTTASDLLIQLLEDYITVSNIVLDKYASEFQMRNDEGELVTMQLWDFSQDYIRAGRLLCEETREEFLKIDISKFFE